MDNIENYIEAGGQAYFTLDDSDYPIACCMIGPREDGDWEIMKFAARSSYSGKGAGTACLKACINYAKGKGVEKIIILSNTKCVKAVHLYKKLGFNLFLLIKISFLLTGLI